MEILPAENFARNSKKFRKKSEYNPFKLTFLRNLIKLYIFLFNFITNQINLYLRGKITSENFIK